MSETDGIEAVFLETHNWGKAARFFQALGFELELETDHASGQLRNGDGPYVFVAEVPENQEAHVQIVLQSRGLRRNCRRALRNAARSISMKLRTWRHRRRRLLRGDTGCRQRSRASFAL